MARKEKQTAQRFEVGDSVYVKGYGVGIIDRLFRQLNSNGGLSFEEKEYASVTFRQNGRDIALYSFLEDLDKEILDTKLWRVLA